MFFRLCARSFSTAHTPISLVRVRRITDSIFVYSTARSLFFFSVTHTPVSLARIRGVVDSFLVYSTACSFFFFFRLPAYLSLSLTFEGSSILSLSVRLRACFLFFFDCPYVRLSRSRFAINRSSLSSRIVTGVRGEVSRFVLGVAGVYVKALGRFSLFLLLFSFTKA